MKTNPQNSPPVLVLPLDSYGLSKEDTIRFAEEAQLDMVAPKNPILQQVAARVDPKLITSAEIQAVIARLLRTANNQLAQRKTNKKRRTLVGLAAPQIGESLRIIVVDTKATADRKKLGALECFMNPEIIWRSRETEEGREGCFSAGPVWGLVRRPIALKVRAYTIDGKQVERIFEGFTARIVQHECDHLNGIRFPDRIVSDRKRHWVHTEEIPNYIVHIKHWPRLCSRERWQQFVRG